MPKLERTDEIIELRKEERRKGEGFETRSAPALTHVLPRIRPVGFPIYVAPPAAAPFTRYYPSGLTFYLGNPLPRLKLARPPLSLGATLRAFTFYLGNPFPRFLGS